MLQKPIDFVFPILLALFVGSGYVFNLFAWCDENIGGWFVPVAITALALPIILIPVGRGVVQGMREASQD
ncbi:MAG: hypothetical protein AAGA29_01930 [Planctomycetota bacterium]